MIGADQRNFRVEGVPTGLFEGMQPGTGCVDRRRHPAARHEVAGASSSFVRRETNELDARHVGHGDLPRAMLFEQSDHRMQSDGVGGGGVGVG